MTRTLPATERDKILRRYYAPYRLAVEATAARLLEGGGRAVHLSLHSFTPVLHGKVV